MSVIMQNIKDRCAWEIKSNVHDKEQVSFSLFVIPPCPDGSLAI